MRKLASIQKILEVNEHPNADRLELVKVLGWSCVSKKGTFKPGDLCVYFEIDSLIPIKEWSKFLEDKNKPEKPARLRTMRLRGELSQGLCLPLSILPEDYRKVLGDIALNYDSIESTDVTEVLGIEKYEPPIPTCLSGDAKGGRPGWMPKTDEDRIQAFPSLIEEFQGKLVVLSQKIDGTSCSISYKDGEEDVCGRNWSYKEGDNTYWEVAKKYDVLAKLKRISEETGINYGLQGEVAGPGIQKNRLKLPEHDIFVFNVRNLATDRYLGFYEYKEFCDRLQLKMVPVIKICKFEWKTVEELLEEAKGTYESGRNQEGIVIRPIHEFYSEVLKGRASFKVINNEFLEENEDA